MKTKSAIGGSSSESTTGPGATAGSKKRERTVYGAREKSRAVLSLWTERRKPAAVCRELGITWAQLNAWQQRALEGMLAALEPRATQGPEPPPALGVKLEALLEKAAGNRRRNWSRLEDRLARIQQERSKEPRGEAATAASQGK